MGNIPGRAFAVRPQAVYAYFDKVQLWFREPLDRSRLTRLKQECGRGGIHVDRRPARFGQGYRQRVELRQPFTAALRELSNCSDALVNRVEIALDFVFTDAVA